MQNELYDKTGIFCCGAFSNNYLLKRFPESRLFAEIKPEMGLRQAIRGIYDEHRDNFANKNEAQQEEDVIKPIFSLLGFNYIVQSHIGRRQPDYLIYKTPEEKETAQGKADKERYTNAAAIADAKRWGRSFDKKGGETGKDNDPSVNPSAQIANYLLQSGVEWGILTDGTRWRLYYRNPSKGRYLFTESFVEINLPSVINDEVHFRIFYSLFSGAAFSAEAQITIIRESDIYRSEIGEDLKDRVFDALETICKGYYRNTGDGGDLNDIYEASVILLYRLLFVLFGEKKRILPLDNPNYKDVYSLDKILRDIQYARDTTPVFSDRLTSYYDRLDNLFVLINEGDEKLGITQYNGGLFKNDGLPFLPADFLRKYKVAESYLAYALRKVAYSGKTGNGREEQVDYSDFSVRHLGDIYEGLLEFHPVLESGEIKLVNDRGERKRTGSFYTPQYVIDYIVENTLGPLTDNAKTPEDVLGVSVLDPAMGSGHFLVGAVDYIAEKCFDLAGEESETKLDDYRRIAVEKCVYGVDLNPLAVELAKLSLWLHTIAKNKPLSYLDHHLKLGNSLVGAKIEQLGYLPGQGHNSKEELPLFADPLRSIMPLVVKELTDIIGLATNDIGDIEFKEERMKIAETRLAPFKAVADLWISAYFGNEVKVDEYEVLIGGLKDPSGDNNIFDSESVKRALELAHGDEHRVGKEFFHWELEFPEAFFDENGKEKDNPGFDAVIGNPPWGAELSPPDKTYLEVVFENGNSRNSEDYFIEQDTFLTRNYLGLIIPKSIAFYESRKKPREIILNQYLRTVLDTGIAFKEVVLDTFCFVSSKMDKYDKTSIYRAEPLKKYDEDKTIVEIGNVGAGITNINRVVVLGEITDIDNKVLRKISQKSVFIEDIAERIFANVNLTGIKEITGKTESEILEGPFDTFPTPNKKTQIPFVRRDPDLQIYYVKRWLLLDMPKEYSRVPEIMVPRIFIKPLRGKRLVAGIDIDGSFLTHHHMISAVFEPDTQYSHLFALAVISTPIPSYWLMKTIYSDTTETARELNKPYFNRIPLPEMDFSDDRGEEYEGLVNLYGKADFTNILEKINEVGNNTDLHDFIAYLAGQMLDLNEEKHSKETDFLSWLNAETQQNITAFKPRKYLKFYKYDFDDFYKWMKENGEKLSTDDFNRVKEEYEIYSREVGTLSEQIENTGSLIEEISFSLYDLTKAEKAKIRDWAK